MTFKGRGLQSLHLTSSIDPKRTTLIHAFVQMADGSGLLPLPLGYQVNVAIDRKLVCGASPKMTVSFSTKVLIKLLSR